MKKEQKGAAKKCVTENKKTENYCKFCDLIISKPSNYKRHLKTAKHLKTMVLLFLPLHFSWCVPIPCTKFFRLPVN